MTSLKMAFHGITGRRIVEVYDDSGKVVGTICPSDDGSNGIHIVSGHFAGPPIETTLTGLIRVPGYQVRFARKA